MRERKRKKRIKKIIKCRDQNWYINIFKICFVLVLFLLNIIKININNKIPYYNQFINKNIKASINGRTFLCTQYRNEADTLYIHLWRLYDYVDKFIIVFSNATYTGIPQNLTFEPFEKEIKQYMDKVDIAYFDHTCNRVLYPKRPLLRCIEMSQRDYAKTYIEKNYNPTEKDILIVMDLDEILTREGIQYVKNNPPESFSFIRGAMYFPYYYHRLEDWDMGYVVRYKKNMSSLSEYRGSSKQTNTILSYKYNPNKSLFIHCSYCYKSIEEYKTKLRSFAHQEFNRPPFNTNNYIFRSHYCRRKINSIPRGHDEPYEGWRHLIPDDERLKYLVDRSFRFPLNETTYTESDLERMCPRYNRTPFEPSAKYNP